MFYDASPTGRRRWCDMASCGNRAKAARHRVRARNTKQAAETQPQPRDVPVGARISPPIVG
ncbi:MAG: CGNR zinc finger domain-containing protein [Candidatus Limnocylindrales bacterium]